MYHPSKYRIFTSIVLSVVFLLLSVLPVVAAETADNEKISLDLREQLYTLPEDTVVEIGVIFVDSPTLEADMAERLAAIREDYRTGKLTPAQLFGDAEFDDVDLDIALHRRANAEIYAAYNGRCVEHLEGLIERVAYVGMYASYADLTAKAVNVPKIAALDCVSCVFSEENVSAENEDWALPLFREDPARFGDTNAEGYPPDLSVDGTRNEGWTNGDIDRDGRVTAFDARLALRASVGIWTPFIYEQFYAADINDDYKITAEDARRILRAVVGLEAM